MLAFHMLWRAWGRKWKKGDWHHCRIDTRSIPSSSCLLFHFRPRHLPYRRPEAPQTFGGEMGFISHHPQQLHSGLQLPLLGHPSASCPLETCWNFSSTDIHLPCFSLLYKFIPFCASVSFGRALRRDGRRRHVFFVIPSYSSLQLQHETGWWNTPQGCELRQYPGNARNDSPVLLSI